MKNFVHRVLINYALVVIVLGLVNLTAFGPSEFASFTLELLLVLVTVWVAFMLTARIQYRWPVLEKLLELAAVLAIVLSGGWIFRWYDVSLLGYMVFIIVAVYAGVYAIGIGRAKKDAEYINEQIKLRRIRREQKDESN